MLQFIEDEVLGYFHMQDFISYYVSKNSLKSINAFTMRQTMAMFIEQLYTDAS